MVRRSTYQDPRSKQNIKTAMRTTAKDARFGNGLQLNQNSKVMSRTSMNFNKSPSKKQQQLQPADMNKT